MNKKEFDEIAKMIDKHLEFINGERIGFSLVIYKKPRAQYIGNCDRQESIIQLQALLDYWKSTDENILTSEVN